MHDQDWHKRATNVAAGTIRMIGSMNGHEYDVTVHPEAKRAVFNGGTFEERAGEGDDAVLDRILGVMKGAPSGVGGILAAKLGIHAVPGEVYDERRGKCLVCDQYNGFGVCNKCGCYLDAKIRLKNKKCPEGHWGPYTGITVKRKSKDCPPCKD